MPTHTSTSARCRRAHLGELRVGTDIAEVAEVARAVRDYGKRYTARVFTAAEVADCGGAGPQAAAGLAARFAAKEATVKVLRNITLAELAEIEVRSAADGSPRLRLSGRAARSAHEQHVRAFEVSLSHAAGLATATVIALAEETEQ